MTDNSMNSTPTLLSKPPFLTFKQIYKVKNTNYILLEENVRVYDRNVWDNRTTKEIYGAKIHTCCRNLWSTSFVVI